MKFARSKKLDGEREARLRARLRAGDPASGDPRLAPEEIREMRRRMLAALPERRRPRLLLALASAATAALALALGLALHHEMPPPVPVPAPSPVTIPAPPPATAPLLSTTQPITDRAPAARQVRASHRSRRRARNAVVATAAPAPAIVAAAAPEPSPAPLQIQFETPGGTRVVWVLEPAKPSRTDSEEE